MGLTETEVSVTGGEVVITEAEGAVAGGEAEVTVAEATDTQAEVAGPIIKVAMAKVALPVGKMREKVMRKWLIGNGGTA